MCQSYRKLKNMLLHIFLIFYSVDVTTEDSINVVCRVLFMPVLKEDACVGRSITLERNDQLTLCLICLNILLNHSSGSTIKKRIKSCHVEFKIPYQPVYVCSWA